jgi:heptosyltransferase III
MSTKVNVQMNRILIIRGGAIGDFILTLPAIRAVRDAYPDAVVHILGYKHIAALAEQRFYAEAVRSIEYGPLSGFFAKDAELNPELREYFGSFDLVISYLFDPDGIFEANLRRSGATRIVAGPSKIRLGVHATRQLAAPIEKLGINVTDYRPTVFPSEADREFAAEFLNDLPRNVVALHPGSGSTQKNWTVDRWIELGNRLLGQNHALLVVSGEADQTQLDILKRTWKRPEVRFATNLALPNLAAIFAETVFVGHDSGISHLAAATGAKCLLLFGPSDPGVWAPQGNNVRVIRAPNGDLNQLRLKPLLDALAM